MYGILSGEVALLTPVVVHFYEVLMESVHICLRLIAYIMGATEEIKHELGELSDKGAGLRGLIKYDSASPDFIERYQEWYTRAIKIASLLGKDRLDEFRSYYLPDPKRDPYLTNATYTIQDYVSGVQPKENLKTGISSVPLLITSKFSSQLGILKSLSSRIDSVLSDVLGHLSAELQDEELKVASKLMEINLRAAGAVAGVVLEGHLQRVAANHSVTISKTNPTINDMNDPLKNDGIYDIVTWRKIQHLADIRNYCDHKKEREPTIEEVKELIVGTDSIIKTIF